MCPVYDSWALVEGGREMGKIENFSEKIRERLGQDLKERSERMLEVNRSMEQLLARKGRFETVARDILTSVVYPRLQALSQNFENSRLTDIKGVPGLYCACKFSHTQRFPATVSLEFSLFPGQEYKNLDVHYKLKIFPMLMEYNQHEERSFPLEIPGGEDIGAWVEARILEFLDTYLKLETHPLYQKDNFVVDPVCGMKIPLVSATSSIEQEGRVIYFCSEACRMNFLKRPHEG
jgi:YHS domain-containing protein